MTVLPTNAKMAEPVWTVSTTTRVLVERATPGTTVRQVRKV